MIFGFIHISVSFSINSLLKTLNVFSCFRDRSVTVEGPESPYHAGTSFWTRHEREGNLNPIKIKNLAFILTSTHSKRLVDLWELNV